MFNSKTLLYDVKGSVLSIGISSCPFVLIEPRESKNTDFEIQIDFAGAICKIIISFLQVLAKITKIFQKKMINISTAG